jgi:hypothetical protein
MEGFWLGERDGGGCERGPGGALLMKELLLVTFFLNIG